MIFPFLRWTIVPTARLPPASALTSGCLHSIRSQLLPLKFDYPVPYPSPPVFPGNLTQLFAYLEKLLQFSSLPALPRTLGLVCREGESGNLYWKRGKK